MEDQLAVLLLPSRLEDFDLAPNARDLIAIPRVLALEPRRARKPWHFSDIVAVRQARRLHLPGELRIIVLYHPRQYPLARALLGRHERAELWYVVPESATVGASAEDRDELTTFDELARERAAQLLSATVDGDPRAENEPLRRRMVELEVISSRAFLAGVRLQGARRQGP